MALLQVQRRPVRIAVLGSEKVGKTACVTRFLYGTFSPEYKPTQFEIHVPAASKRNGSLQRIEIMDVSGRMEITALQDTRLKDANAFLVVYSVVNKKSLKRAIKICHHVFGVHGLEVPLILLGNQIDLKAGKAMSLTKRVKYVQKKTQCFHMECSAKTNQDVKQIFGGLIELARRKAVNDYLTQMKQKTSSRVLGNNYCDFMPPRRISKVAIPELAEQEERRVTASSRVNGQHDSTRTLQVSPASSTPECLASSHVDKRKKSLGSQPLWPDDKSIISCKSRRVSIVSEATVRKLSWTNGDQNLTDPIPDKFAKKLSIADSSESIIDEHFKDESAHSLFIRNYSPLAVGNKQIDESKTAGTPDTPHRRRRYGLSHPQTIHTCKVLPVHAGIETLRAAREACIAEHRRSKKRKGCVIM